VIVVSTVKLTNSVKSVKHLCATYHHFEMFSQSSLISTFTLKNLRWEV